MVLVIHSDGTTETVEVPRGLGAGAFVVGAAVVTALIWAALRSVRPAGSELPLDDPSPGGKRFKRSKKASKQGLGEDDDDDDDDDDEGEGDEDGDDEDEDANVASGEDAMRRARARGGW